MESLDSYNKTLQLPVDVLKVNWLYIRKELKRKNIV